MLLIKVEYVVKEGMRQAFYDAVTSNGIDVSSQREEGNMKYEYSFSKDDENVLLLDEVWKDTDSQKAHTQTEHFKRLGELKAKYVLDTKITISNQ